MFLTLLLPYGGSFLMTNSSCRMSMQKLTSRLAISNFSDNFLMFAIPPWLLASSSSMLVILLGVTFLTPLGEQILHGKSCNKMIDLLETFPVAISSEGARQPAAQPQLFKLFWHVNFRDIDGIQIHVTPPFL